MNLRRVFSLAILLLVSATSFAQLDLWRQNWGGFGDQYKIAVGANGERVALHFATAYNESNNQWNVLSRNPPVGGGMVSLTDIGAYFITPSSVTVPQGFATASFPIDTVALTTTATRQVHAKFNGVLKVSNLTLTP